MTPPNSGTNTVQFKIRIPEEMRFYIRQAAQVRGYTNMSEYVRQLLLADMEQAIENFSRSDLYEERSPTPEPESES